MRLFTDTADTLRIAILSTSLIAIAAYSRWHFWWRSGFGRARMAALLSIAALTLVPLLYRWTGVDRDFSSIPDDAIAWFDVAALAGVLSWVSYSLFRIVRVNIRRVRCPEEAIRHGRRYLERTPHASREEIEKLTACWDELHSGRPGSCPDDDS